MTTIAEAKNLRSDINLEVRVASVGEPRTVNLRDGGTSDVCDAVITDPTGEMKLTLWNDDIQKVTEGDIVKITNGYTTEFKGEAQLSFGKFGKMEVNPPS